MQFSTHREAGCFIASYSNKGLTHIELLQVFSHYHRPNSVASKEKKHEKRRENT